MSKIAWLSIFFVLTKGIASGSFNLESKWQSDVEVLEDSFDNRAKRESFAELGSGDFLCESTDTKTCKKIENACSCSCKPQFYPVVGNEGDLGCTRGKFFGGEVVFSGSVTKEDANITLMKMFEGEYFVTVAYISLAPPSRSKAAKDSPTTATYQLVYQNVPEVDSNYITNELDKKYNCTETNFTIEGGSEVNLNASCDTFIDEESNAVCSQPPFSDYCDKESTDCSVLNTGYVQCECKTNFFRSNATVCQEQVCTSNADCNSPFGTCDGSSSIRTCSCIWGFDGINCYESYLFSLVVVASGCALIIFCLMIALCCCSRKNKKIKKVPSPSNKEKTYEDEEDAIPPLNPSTYQPGLMRARIPNSAYPPARSSSDIRLGYTGSRNGHSNTAYDKSPYSSSTTTFNSPRKQQRMRDPTDYF